MFPLASAATRGSVPFPSWRLEVTVAALGLKRSNSTYGPLSREFFRELAISREPCASRVIFGALLPARLTAGEKERMMAGALPPPDPLPPEPPLPDPPLPDP